jgi:signal transduction histidine kinase
VEVSGVPTTPLGEAIEAAAYFVTAEALTNMAKHACAERAFVHLSLGSDCLRVEIRDDGVGGADPAGSGLHGLCDRVEALDGRLEVDSPPGAGTSVTVLLPLAGSANGGH